MPKKRNQQYWESMELLNNHMQNIELDFIKTLKNLIFKSKNIVEIETELYITTNEFFENILNNKFLEEIDEVNTQYKNEYNYQNSNDGLIHNTSVIDKKKIDQATYEKFKKCQYYLNFCKNNYSTKNTLKHRKKVSKFIREILKNNNDVESLKELNLKEKTVRNYNFWKNIETKIKEIKTIEEKLQNTITNIIKYKSNINIINDKIVSNVDKFITTIKKKLENIDFENLKKEDYMAYSFFDKYSQPSDSELSTQKNKDELNFKLLNNYYQKYVKNSKNLIFNGYKQLKQDIAAVNKQYEDKRLKIIQPYITNSNGALTNNDFLEEDDDINQNITPQDKEQLNTIKKLKNNLIQQTKKEYYKNKDNVQFFLNKEILSKQHKVKIEQKLKKHLQIKPTVTLNYFKELENNFFNPLSEELNNFENDVRTINSNYKNNLEEIKKIQNNNKNTELIDEQEKKLNQEMKEKIFQEMKEKRVEILTKFENKNSSLLEKLDNLTTTDKTKLEIFKKELLSSEAFTLEAKNIYYTMCEKINEFKETIDKHKQEVADISNKNKVDKIYEYLENIETYKEQDKISKLLTIGIIDEDQETKTFVDKLSGEPLNTTVIQKLLFLEKELLINNKLDDISRGIKEWDKGINNLFDANEVIKDWKPYKNLTTVKETKIVTKNGILNFKPFPNLDDNANRRAQFLLVTHKREEKIKDYLAISAIKNHTFEGTIGKFITLKDKSIWDKIVHWKNLSIKWLGQATYINQKSDWPIKRTALLLLVSPFTLTYGTIKSVNHKLRKWFAPKADLKVDFDAIKQLKTELDQQCDTIKIKYAKLMAIPLEERSIFSIGKTDGYYLAKTKAETDKAIAKFILILQEWLKPYENYAKKQDSKYSYNGKTMQKIRTILEDFTKNKIKDANNNDSNYQFATIKELEQVLKDRLKQPDYKNKILSPNMEEIITCANGLSDDLIDKFIKPVLLINP